MNRAAEAIRGVLPILDADWLDRSGLVTLADIRRLRVGRPSTIGSIARFLGECSIASVQLRCKGSSQRAAPFAAVWVEALRTFSPQVAIVINDHVDLAVALAVDGVHVGQGDMPVAQCRHLLGPERMVGLSTHSLEEVRLARLEGVDYVGFGPVFATRTKPDVQATQGLSQLAGVCRAAGLPVVAIGGIGMARIGQVAAAGAAAAAMISGLWDRESWPQRLQQASKEWQEGVPCQGCDEKPR
ncbi:MAG: thiamine phosphate synthase [Magnetococcus sp. MYC-9]